MGRTGSSNRSRLLDDELELPVEDEDYVERDYPFEPILITKDNEQYDVSALKYPYDEYWQKRWIKHLGYSEIPEGGFIAYKDLEDQSYRHTLRRMGLLNFAKHPETSYCVDLVREFYANLDDKNPNEVWVRNTRIPLNRAVIRDIYNLPIIDEDLISKFKFKNQMSEADLEDLQQTVRRHPLPYCFREPSMDYKHLKAEARVWYHFVATRLIPTETGTRVIRHRLGCIYMFLTKQRFDVAGLIIQQMLEVGKENARSLRFPCLVTELCRRFDVPGIVHETEAYSPLPFDNNFLNKVTRQYDSDDTSQQTARVQRRPAKRSRGRSEPETSTGPADSLMREMRALAEHQHLEIRALADYQRQMGAYIYDHRMEMRGYFAAMATHGHVRPEDIPTTIPPPPVYQPPPSSQSHMEARPSRTNPDDDDDDEEMHD